jgi:septal ring factor EnvC (AmiA/AmiB activator)
MKYFSSVRDRIKQRRIRTWVSAVILAASLAGLSNAIFYFLPVKHEPKSELTEQVGAVEASLDRLRDLERSLKSLKKELQEKSQESARVTREYEEAMKLKAITAEQLDQVKKAVNSQTRMETFLTYFWGLLSGVAGSILATIITDKLKQRRVLQGP